MWRWGYLTISSWDWWKFMWYKGNYAGLFLNSEGVIPGRWGFYILGLEFGSRNSRDSVGLFLYAVWEFLAELCSPVPRSYRRRTWDPDN